MPILLTFDVNERYSELAEQLDKKCYRWVIQNEENEEECVSLPDNAIYHAKKTTKEAIDDLTCLCEDLSITLKRAYATEITNSCFIKGDV